MRTALVLVGLALVSLAGCLGTRPGVSSDDEDGGGMGGSTPSLVGAGGGGAGHGAGGSSDAGSPGTGGGGATGVGGRGTGGQPGSGGAGSGGKGSGLGGQVGGSGAGGSGGVAGAGAGGTAAGAGGMTALPATLSGTTSKDFSNLQLGSTSPTFNWTIRNATGAASTGPLVFTNGDPPQVSVNNGCVGSLAGGASCTVAVTFQPSATGARNALLTMTATPGGSVTLSLTASGFVQVTVTTSGTGTVTSVPAGISCPGTCSAPFTSPSVTLQARTANGSNALFTSWSDPKCAGPFHDCPQNLTTPAISVTATFTTVNANLIFGTLATYPTNLGGTAPYDAACNNVATSAGINNAAGNGYIAVISDSNSNAISRLGTARGWVRMDGKPFADTLTGLFTNNQIFYPFLFQEDGQVHSRTGLLAATSWDGTAFPATCSNWTSLVDTGTPVWAGDTLSGPAAWIEGYAARCGMSLSLLCMGKSKSAAVTVPPPGNGRKIWTTSTFFTPGTATTPDAFCQGTRPTGVTTAAALIATTTSTAASHLDPAVSYYRLDGAFVGTGATIAAMGFETMAGRITSGIWQSEDSQYPLFNGIIWTGSSGLSQLGTTASTCGDWTDPSQPAGIYGNDEFTDYTFWDQGTFSCASGWRLYCLQTAP